MKQRVWFGMLAVVAIALAGCGKATSPLQAPVGGTAPSGSDQSQVSALVESNPDVVDEDVWQSADAQAFDGGVGMAAIRPLRFWRVITSVERSVDTQFGPPDSSGRPTTALVTVSKHLLGSFNIVAGGAEPADTARSLVRKPLNDQWTRKLVFVRMPAPADSGRGRWHLVGSSGVDVHTRGGSTRIQSLRIQSAGVDTVITDPLELHRLRRVLLIQPGEPVTLTVNTGNASDIVLFYGHDSRRRFANNGGGSFSFEFTAGQFPGLRNMGVDALSNGTLFDDTAAYDANAWLLAFAVDPRRAPIDRN